MLASEKKKTSTGGSRIENDNARWISLDDFLSAASIILINLYICFAQRAACEYITQIYLYFQPLALENHIESIDHFQHAPKYICDPSDRITVIE